MSNTGGTRAWEFLRRNPGYIEAESEAPPAPVEPAPFPMRVQTKADLAAAAWGLLAWEDPHKDGPASPFWRDVPMPAAAPAPGARPLVEVLDVPGWRLSGLRLADGGTVLKVEHAGAAAQLMIEEGFDPADGIALRFPAVQLDLRTPLLEAAAVWPIVAARSKKADAAFPTPSSSRCSTAGSPAVACA